MDNYTFNQIKQKLDKGQFLSKAESDYLDLEARQALDNVVARHGSKGGSFLVALAAKLQAEGNERQAKDRQKAGYQPPQQQQEPQLTPLQRELANQRPENSSDKLFGGDYE